ncbi:kelch-like protein 24 [Branchiostoma lanceolatum]|uniref:kelch-like protein 24 n=1 Tax=Branchiostoma lanceolatum TaxID=7740 RepID=UPI003456B09D
MDDSPDPEVDSFVAAWFFQDLRNLRSKGVLVDVTLCAEGKEIPCHRLVLAASSEYFEAMFGGGLSESKKDKIEIGGVSAEALQQLVDFAYTSRITVNNDNIQPLFVAANMLEFVHVQMACEKFLTESLSPDTCVGIWGLADKMSCEELSDKARHCAMKNFEQACATEEFLELPFDLLLRYISDDGLQAKKEEQVLEVVMLWTRHNLEERQKHLKELLRCVCFSRMDRNYLENILKEDKVLAAVRGIKQMTKSRSKNARPRQILQNEILALGGVKGRDIHGNIIMSESIYRLELDSHCVDSDPLPQQIRETLGFAACVLDNDVIVTGGSMSLRQAWRYRPSQKSWMWLGDLKKGRHWHGMVVLQGKVYVVGGLSAPDTTESISDVEVYNKKTNRWKKVAPLLQGANCFGVTTCCGKMYIFGGEVNEHYDTDAVQCYDPAQNEWTFKLHMPDTMANIKACTVGSKIYFVGGMFTCVWSFDPETDDYEELADRLVPWDHCSATVCGSEIYITGGNAHLGSRGRALYDLTGDDSYLRIQNQPTVQCYDTVSDTMVWGKDLPVSLDGHCTITIPKV